MAHLEKYTASALGHMFAHYNRNKASSTSLIDPARTSLNYNLAQQDQPLPQLEFLHKKLSEIKVLKRADVNVMCSWIVTVPENVSPSEYDTFFRECYKFLTNRYGKENVISAYVHMNETTPHVHYAFVPVAEDKKKHIPKLSAKEVITWHELKTFHTDLTAHMTKVFGRDIGILNGATAFGNQTVSQLRNSGEKLKSYADTNIRTSTNIVTKVMGKDKVIVSESDIASTQKAAAETAAAIEEISSASEKIKNIKKSADRNYEKSEQVLNTAQSKAAEIEKQAELSADKILRSAKNKAEEIISSVNSEKTTWQTERNEQQILINTQFAEISERRKQLDKERERLHRDEQHNSEIARLNDKEQQFLQNWSKELEQKQDDPHKYYGGKIAEKDREISVLKDAVNQKDSEINLLNGFLSQKDEQIADLKTRFRQEMTEKELALTESFNEKLSAKDKLIESLKVAVNKAYKIICNICRAAAVLWCGKGRFTKYCADFTSEQQALMCAILNYGSKCADEANFPDLARKIDEEYCISDDIMSEMQELMPEVENTGKEEIGR